MRSLDACAGSACRSPERLCRCRQRRIRLENAANRANAASTTTIPIAIPTMPPATMPTNAYDDQRNSRSLAPRRLSSGEDGSAIARRFGTCAVRLPPNSPTRYSWSSSSRKRATSGPETVGGAASARAMGGCMGWGACCLRYLGSMNSCDLRLRLYPGNMLGQQPFFRLSGRLWLVNHLGQRFSSILRSAANRGLRGYSSVEW